MAAIFLDSEEILLIDYKDEDAFIAGVYYASILERLKEVIKDKERIKLKKSTLLLYNNPPASYPA